jgi:hypothetical protein
LLGVASPYPPSFQSLNRPWLGLIRRGRGSLFANKEPIVNAPDNGDKERKWTIGSQPVVGLGSFHKTLPHNEFGEVCPQAFKELVDAAAARDGSRFQGVTPGGAPFTNPQGGLALDRLVDAPVKYVVPPAPKVDSKTTAAEFIELSWMALLRDEPFTDFAGSSSVKAASKEVDQAFADAIKAEPNGFTPGKDTPSTQAVTEATAIQRLFRLGMPGELEGPMLSQFFVRPAVFGTQEIDQTQVPYRAGQDYLTTVPAWLHAQNTGQDADGGDYSASNEARESNFEAEPRYISTMRDLARFVNKDALHQAYFNAALLLLSGKARWTPGNPYKPGLREAGFGVLGGPHILALVSEVATRALKVVWNQKWQVHLRLRPEAYGGLVHMQTIGVNGDTRDYKLPETVIKAAASQRILARYGSRLLPMAYTAGSPTHPAYGAGHATVAGACVTVLKAYFDMDDEHGEPAKFTSLVERDRRVPYGTAAPMQAYVTGRRNGVWGRFPLSPEDAPRLTIEGELNKLAQNVAMGRSMGGVHWRTDNARSLILGEAIAARILYDIMCDVKESDTFKGVAFQFRTFARGADGKPKTVKIAKHGVTVNGQTVDFSQPISDLSQYG